MHKSFHPGPDSTFPHLRCTSKFPISLNANLYRASWTTLTSTTPLHQSRQTQPAIARLSLVSSIFIFLGFPILTCPLDVKQGPFANLPLEVRLKIFDELDKDEVHVVCLGLTCKSLYFAWQDHVKSKNKKSLRKQPKCRLDVWTLTPPHRQLHHLIDDSFPKAFIYFDGGWYRKPIYMKEENLGEELVGLRRRLRAKKILSSMGH